MIVRGGTARADTVADAATAPPGFAIGDRPRGRCSGTLSFPSGFMRGSGGGRGRRLKRGHHRPAGGRAHVRPARAEYSDREASAVRTALRCPETDCGSSPVGHRPPFRRSRTECPSREAGPADCSEGRRSPIRNRSEPSPDLRTPDRAFPRAPPRPTWRCGCEVRWGQRTIRPSEAARVRVWPWPSGHPARGLVMPPPPPRAAAVRSPARISGCLPRPRSPGGRRTPRTRSAHGSLRDDPPGTGHIRPHIIEIRARALSARNPTTASP